MATERFPGGLRRYQNYDQERRGRINFSKIRACPQARAPHPKAGVADPGGVDEPEGGTDRILVYRRGPEVAAIPQPALEAFVSLQGGLRAAMEVFSSTNI